jgi:hypothetical protein
MLEAVTTNVKDVMVQQDSTAGGASRMPSVKIGTTVLMTLLKILE